MAQALGNSKSLRRQSEVGSKFVDRHPDSLTGGRENIKAIFNTYQRQTTLLSLFCRDSGLPAGEQQGKVTHTDLL